MTANPSVSVIIPTYNRAETIGPVIASVINQTLPVSEIVIIDDGSTDGTDAAINEVFRENSQWKDRLTHLKQPNGGKSSALNLGLPHAHSDWIAFNDSDDLWKTDKLEKQFKAIDRFPHCKGCFTDTLYGYDGTTTTLEIAGIKPQDDVGVMEDLTLLLASRASGIMMQTLVVHSEIMRAFGSFDTRLTVSQDTDLMFRLSLLTDFCYVSEPLVLLDREVSRTDKLTRRHPTSNPARLKEDLLMHAKWKSFVEHGDTGLIRVLNARYLAMLSALSNSYSLARDYQNADECMRRAFAESKSVKFGAKWLMMKLFPKLTRAMIESRLRHNG
jgi:glycosyltransferase involved in cell wall biosynthesis